MEQFSLTTLVKIFLMDTGSRISELQKKIESQSGYDYYNTYARAFRSYIADRDIDRANEIISEPRNEHERKNNAAAFDALVKKFGASRTLSAVTTKKIWTPKGAKFSVVVAPLFELEKAGSRHIYLTWALQKPELTQRYGAVACYIMRQAFAGHSLANASFFCHDLVSNRTYSEKQITNQTSKIFQSDARWLSQELADLA